MGTSSSREFDIQETKEIKELEELKETIRLMKWRISKLEAENAVMNKTITNVKVSNNELAKTVAKLHKRVFDSHVNENLSVRIPKLSRYIYSISDNRI